MLLSSVDHFSKLIFFKKSFHEHYDSVRVYAVRISKFSTNIVGTQNRQVACVHGTQDQMQLIFNTFKPAQ